MIDHPFVTKPRPTKTFQQKMNVILFPDFKCAKCGEHIIDHPSQSINIPPRYKKT